MRFGSASARVGRRRARALLATAAQALVLLAAGRANAASDAPAGGNEPREADLEPRSTPQWHVALGSGLGSRRERGETSLLWENTLSSHVLFGRARDSDWGVGPYLRASYLWRTSESISGGGSLLLPLSATFPFILSVGGVVDWQANASARAGLEGWLFAGPSSYNFHSSYSMASGLLLGVQHTWGTASTTTLVLAAQVDMVWLALPFIALFEVLRGPPVRSP